MGHWKIWQLDAGRYQTVSSKRIISQWTFILYWKKNSVALVRERTIPTERPLPVGEVSANWATKILTHHLLWAFFPGRRPATSWVHYTTSCNTQSSAPEDGQNNFPKHVELTGIINKPLLLRLVGCLYCLYQWCTVEQISDNEIYLLIKYIKSVLWRVVKRLSLYRRSLVPKG